MSKTLCITFTGKSRLYLLCLFVAIVVSESSAQIGPVLQADKRPQLHRGTMHDKEVTTLDFAQGEKTLLATGSEDATVKLYDAKTGREIRTLRSHKKQIFQLVFSPDGRLLASASEDGSLVLWDVEKGTPKFTFRSEQSSPLTSAAFNSDGSIVAAGAWDENVYLWNTATGAKIKTEGAQSGYVTALAFHPRIPNLLATGGTDHFVRLWDTTNWRLLHTLKGHEGTINSLAFSPKDQDVLASGRGDYTIRIWNTKTGLERAKLSGHVYGVNAIAFSNDALHLVSCSDDATIKVWNLASHKEKQTLRGHRIKVRAVDFDPESGHLVSAGSDETIKFWDDVTGNCYRTLTLASFPFNQVAISRSGKEFAIGIREVKLWRVAEGQDVKVLGSHDGFVTGLAFSDDGRLLASAAEDRVIKLWDVMRGREESRLVGHTTKVVRVVFGPKAILLASVDDGGEIKIWDVKSGNVKHTLEIHSSPLTSLTFSPDGEGLASAYWNGDIKLARMSDGHPRITIKAPPRSSPIGAIAFSPDGKLLATGDWMSSISKIKLWSVQTGRRLGELSSRPSSNGEIPVGNHDDDILSVVFSDDNKLLYSSSTDGTIKTWNVLGRNESAVFRGHRSAVRTVVLMSQRQIAVSGSVDGQFIVWNTKNFQELARLEPIADADWLVAAPDGLFDGFPSAWRHVIWRFTDRTLDYSPVESFFNEFYKPGLFRNILEGRESKAPREISSIDRRQATLNLTLLTREAKNASSQRNVITERTIDLEIEAEEAPKTVSDPSGEVRDLRLFRNGLLIKVWHGQALAELDGKAGCTMAQPRQPGRRRIVCRASVPIVSGENRFTAYAFNRHNVKSEDAELTVYGHQQLERKSTLYVLAVGIDKYENTNYDLSFAVTDAKAFGDAVKDQQEKKLRPELRRYSRVEVIPLLDAKATKANIVHALRRFAGLDSAPLDSNHPLATVKATEPEDVVMIYFAGHGKTIESTPGSSSANEFYLIPHDMGYMGSRVQLDNASLEKIKLNSISSKDLKDELERLDVSQLILIVDACNSGQALDMLDARQGPMNSKALGQLAYEKGMYVLTASQAFESAKESATLGGGYGFLTYALVEEGLKQGLADSDKDKTITLREWLDFAVQRVPSLQSEREAKCRAEIECPKQKKELVDQWALQKGQRPRVFYRRQADTFPLAITTVNEVEGQR